MTKETDNIFNQDFYPTPDEVIYQMISGLHLEGKTVLEPSAGSGSILSVLKLLGAKTIACELSKDLAEISKTKCDVFLKNDFLQVTSIEVSHIDYIIANPPFSCADSHITHMWDIAPDGCEIITLCNIETINNDYSRGRKSLSYLIRDYGNYVNLGECFLDSQRKTSVEVALIKLFKPKSESDNEFNGYFDLSEDYEKQENGIMQYSEVKNIVNRYVGACQQFNTIREAEESINSLINPINVSSEHITFGCFEYRGGSHYLISRDEFKKKLQKSAWESIFKKLNFEKYLTKGVLEKINKFVEQQTNVPFTVRNVHKMIEIIIATSGQNMDKVIVEAFDSVTKYYDENRYGVEGWKTNDCFMVNKRFILPSLISISYTGKMQANYSINNNAIEDLTKALCYLTGRKYDEIGSFYSFMQNFKKVEKNGVLKDEYLYREFNTWYEFGFFKLKGYKKGTIHCEFLDEKVWEKFNITAVKAKGWSLPSTTKHSYRSKETGVEIY